MIGQSIFIYELRGTNNRKNIWLKTHFTDDNRIRTIKDINK